AKTGGGSHLSARERLLDAASELFYREGVHTVGIDRVIAQAGVAKASLYNTFGSKDELIRAYLVEWHERWKRRIVQRIAKDDGNPREQLLGVFDALHDSFTEPEFRGCAFVNACAESAPGAAAEEAADVGRAWVRSIFTELGKAAGASAPEHLAAQLVLLYDGATVAARMDRDPAAAAVARGIAAALVDAAIAA
ncbi:TetR/AcrR family transcriptional regulator, partial [Dactylosporangium darangshiense]